MSSNFLRPKKWAPRIPTMLSGFLASARGRWDALKIGCRRLYKVAKPFWVAPDSRLQAWLHLALILVLMFANARINVQISVATNHFITSIARRDPQALRDYYLHVCALLVVAVTPVAVYYAYFRSRLALCWRQWLANSFFASYYRNLAFRKLIAHTELDNPDQRMSQDVDSFCNSVVGLFISFVDAAMQIILWSGVLWQISHSLTLTVIIYAVSGTIVVMLIGRALIALTNQQMRSEADLRRTLQNVVREADSIAFTHGEPVAEKQTRNRLQIVIDTLLNMIKKNRNISLFTTLFNGLVPLIAPWFIGALYVAGAVHAFGTITQAGMAVGALVGALTLLMAQFPGIASFLAIVHRLGTLKEAIDNSGIDPLPPDKRITISEGTDVVFDGVTVLSADLKRTFVRKLNLRISKGESALVIGDYGVGKTELLMVLAGVTNAGQGKLQRPPFAQVVFLSQKPYLPPSTLREALCYPDTQLCRSDDEMLKALRFVELPDLAQRVGGLDAEQAWEELLTLSEQQRLALARLFFRKPAYVVLDEATSNLDKPVEKLVLGALMGMGTTVVSASANDSMAPFYTWVLLLSSDGSYRLVPGSNYHPAAA